MGKYNKILVAVDGSESSLHALKESLRLAANRVTVVSVAPPFAGDLSLVGVENIEALMREPCETALAKAQELAEAAGAFINTVCAIGEPHERIVDLAESENFDLIVMGAKGHSFLERALIGSVTARVIGYSYKDVLVVPPKARIGWEKMLLATDGSADSLRATERALDLAQAYGGKLNILSILEPAPQFYTVPEVRSGWLKGLEECVGKVKTEAELRGIRAKAMVREGFPYQVITDLAREEKMHLIIMGSHGRTGLKRLLMGSVTERVIGHAPCPVLVVKA